MPFPRSRANTAFSYSGVFIPGRGDNGHAPSQQNGRALSEARTQDLQIMRLTRCLLR